MNSLEKEALYELLRIAVGANDATHCLTHTLDAEQWLELHSVCLKQQIVAVVYHAICRLPKEQLPPLDVAFQWASEAETVKGHNQHLNAETARLTGLFTAQGCKTAVLKGPANARLYPDPNMRHAGDIDLWVDGGRDSVLDLLKNMGYKMPIKMVLESHHVHLHPTNNDVIVEIHYRPSSGNLNPFSSARLMRFLEKEIQNVERVPEGFYVPTMKFALAMQLSHILHHFLTEGVGFKQILDYYMLLKHSSEDDRREVASCLSNFGLSKMAGALMWILGEVMGLAPSKMLCKPDKMNGQKVLSMILQGGNFGRHPESDKPNKSKHWAILWFKRRWHIIRMFWFAPVDIVGCELDYWFGFLKSIWLRIKLRRLSIWYLRD